MLPVTMFGGAAQEYRNIDDDKRYVVDDTAQLPCAGPASCTFEPLPQGGDYITVLPKSAPAQSTPQSSTPQYVPTAVVEGRSLRDVLLEALALGMMGGGAVMFGYGLGKPKTAAVVGGLALIAAGAGLRLGVLTPWFVRAKDALLAPGMQRVP